MAGEGLLVAVVAVPDVTELRAMVRAGRSFTPRLALLVDTRSHAGRGDRSPDADARAESLRMSGWRVAVVAAGDRLDQRWGELVLQPRRAAGAAR